MRKKYQKETTERKKWEKDRNMIERNKGRRKSRKKETKK